MLDWVKIENPVAIWWMFLTFASFFNILLWTWVKYYKFKNAAFKSIWRLQDNPQATIWLSFLYVVICAYRSIFPKADVQRIALFDSYLSSVFLGRSLATVAELAFVAQWFILISVLARISNENAASRIAKLFLPLIVVAEICSWFAVITTNYMGNVIEESLWALTYALIAVCLFLLQKHYKDYFRAAINFALSGSLLYVLFMILIDVPMYLRRFLEDSAANRKYFGFAEGLYDLNTRWIVTHDIAVWKEEIPWMTLYFTIAVLVSMAMCVVPTDAAKLEKYLKKS